MGPDGTRRHGFESSVISYGSQTPVRASAKKVKCLRVVLSHMVVKRTERYMCEFGCLRVVLFHMVVKRKAVYRGKK